MILDRRFSGVARLFGNPARERFAASHVAVIGIGGVGCWAAEALARTGVGRLTLIDLDVVAESNTNRQIHALGDEYGKSKAVAMAERVAAINPDCEVVAIEDFVTEDKPGDHLSQGFDYVLDAIDQTRAKVAISAWCQAHGVPIVVAGAAGGRRDPTRIRTDDLALATGDSLLSRVRQLLRQRHGFPREARRPFGIRAVFSAEPMNRQDDLCPSAGGLNCSGYGSSVAVTGGFGFAMAACALDDLARGAARS